MMKTFFEDLTKRLGETAELVGNKANEAMEVQRLKNQIRTLERNNEDDLAELGRVLYEKFLNGEELEAEEEALCEAIQDREESIEEYNEQIVELRGDTNCAACGKSIAKGMAYCPYCGEKVSTSVPTDADFVDEEDIVVDVKETVDEVKEEPTATQEKEEPEDKPQVQADELKEEPEAQADELKEEPEAQTEENVTESPEE